jgi:hypothetical protein
MRSEEQFKHKDSKPRKPRRNYDLFWYQKEGSRYYLRVNLFMLALLILVTIIAFAIIGLNAYFSQEKSDANVNTSNSTLQSAPQSLNTPTPITASNKSASHPMKNK